MNYHKIIRRSIPVLIGAALGFAYYYFIGCYGGSCPITGNPIISTLYGGLLGLVISFPNRKKGSLDVKNKSSE